MRQARAGGAALVDAGEHTREPRRASRRRARPPRVGDEPELCSFQVRDRADVLGSVDDHLLAVEGRELVRDDPDRPARSVGLTTGGEREDLGRRAVLASLAERAALPLVRRFGLERRPAGAGPLRPAGRDGDQPPGERVYPQIAQESSFGRSRNALSRSIGAGNTIVVDGVPLISIKVCR